MTELDTTGLRLERTFEAPAEDVFDAWTNPEVLRRWWAAGPQWRTPLAEVDLREGGSYRLSMEDPATGAIHTVGGKYREVRRPDRLVYSWCWELEDGGRSEETSTVTVEFREHSGRTTVVLEHTDLPSPTSRDQHRSGWEGCLENLGARVLTPLPDTA
ncbi:MAG TPA: SRPBCC domain-containing protein [Solirubrobacteraceae bacterium]|jgi:uncharacterized protein YndB with AHSA1/START domain|nr:SRPBCC domain-containing protein [Solirubrobacteraceae bacterium]